MGHRSRPMRICQVADTSVRDRFSCKASESGGLQCEVDGIHVSHHISEHTINHAMHGNGYACDYIDRIRSRPQGGTGRLSDRQREHVLRRHGPGKAGYVHTAEELALWFGCSRRTIERVRQGKRESRAR